MPIHSAVPQGGIQTKRIKGLCFSSIWASASNAHTTASASFGSSLTSLLVSPPPTTNAANSIHCIVAPLCNATVMLLLTALHT